MAVTDAVVVFISKSYFDGFLKEAGKDHYHQLKRGLGKLVSRFTGTRTTLERDDPPNPGAQRISPRYSLVFSIYAELSDEVTVKLLLPIDFSAEESIAASNCFLNFVDAFHEGRHEAVPLTGLPTARPHGRTLLVTYNVVSQHLEIVNPGPKT